MTLILIFDALQSGKIRLDDQVVTSAYAKSMGGSQVFLEEGEMQTVETLIKCIVIASGNDASVAMAEYIGGDEGTFVPVSYTHLDVYKRQEKYGTVLRAKGMLPDENGVWHYFDMVPEETEVREGAPIYTGKVCVIGSGLKEDDLKELFH